MKDHENFSPSVSLLIFPGILEDKTAWSQARSVQMKSDDVDTGLGILCLPSHSRSKPRASP
jgi:hypothetical protein